LRSRHVRATLFPYTTLFRAGEAHGVTPRGYAGKATNEGRTRFRETILMAAREMSRPRHWPRRESPERIKTKKTSLPERYSPAGLDRKSTRLNSSHSQISYAV